MTEQVGGACREQDGEEDQDVVGDQRSDRERERGCQERRYGDGRHPERGETLRWPEQVRVQQVDAVTEGPGPPLERPGHDLEIGCRVEADGCARRMDDHPW